MQKKIHVAVVFNEPTVQTSEGRKFVSETGLVENGWNVYKPQTSNLKPLETIDMSEFGVLEEREDVQLALETLGYQTSLFNVSNNISRLIDFLQTEKPDLIFNLVEGLGSKAIHEMHVAGIYEILEIPYTGNSTTTLGACLNKARTKEILSYHNIPTAKFHVFKHFSELQNENIGLQFPLIIKPANEDASIGIDNNSVVNNFSETKEKVLHIFREYAQPAIVEEYIEGRELNVAIIGNKKPQVLPISEIDFSTLPDGYPQIVTYNAKWMNGTTEYEGTKGKCPAELSSETEQHIKEIALRAYGIMGCRDYARVDVRLSKGNEPFVLEVNPNPDICDDAGFMRSATTFGYSYLDVIKMIVESALERSV
ncbi:MAG: ATP-grasp domain-containing protein [Ignavibacteriales bacterium]|nr:ATP-grasp domain-containing protein [Ignavibacteriales bacterium]